MAAKRSVIYLPCGHFKLCRACDERLHGDWDEVTDLEDYNFFCPECREPIEDRCKVFM
jgi:hypothetical protein